MNVAENVLMASLAGRSRGHRQILPLYARVRPCSSGSAPTSRMLRSFDTLAPVRGSSSEIAKALALEPSVIVFDEPTASLDEGHRERIYAIVRQLAADGAAVLYVSHHMHEIFELSEPAGRPEGRQAGCHEHDRTPDAQRGLESLMVGGRELSGDMPRAAEPGRERRHCACRISTTGGGSAEVSFDIRRGEILGWRDWMGAGRTRGRARDLWCQPRVRRDRGRRPCDPIA